MKKGEIINISGVLARTKPTTRKARKALIDAKMEWAESNKDLNGLNEQDANLRLGEFYRIIADHIFDFPSGLPDVDFFASEDFEDGELKAYEEDFLGL